MTRDKEKCPLSVLTAIRIKRDNISENIKRFVGTNGTVHHRDLEFNCTVIFGFYMPIFFLQIFNPLDDVLLWASCATSAD